MSAGRTTWSRAAAFLLPEDTGVGRSGLEARPHAATDARPPHEWAGSYAQICLAKLRSHATDVLDADDLAALDALLDETQPHGTARGDYTPGCPLSAVCRKSP